MNPLTPDDGDAGTIADPLDGRSPADRSARLVRLLGGEGLNRSTVDELLRPESFAELGAILNDLLPWGPGRAPWKGQDPEDDRAAASSRSFRTGER